MRTMLTLLGLLMAVIPAAAQPIVPSVARTIDLSGPRFGITSLSPGVVDALHNRNIDVTSVVSQFGWQVERQVFAKGSSVTAVSEWVGLIGGLDQSQFLPSLSWLVGVRTAQGAEFGIGPNITPAGSALVIAAGVTFRAGVMNIPMNFAVVPSKSGMRVTMLSGFNFRQH